VLMNRRVWRLLVHLACSFFRVSLPSRDHGTARAAGRGLTSSAWEAPRHHARCTRIRRGRERGRERRGR
jgi:hypothetical protein